MRNTAIQTLFQILVLQRGGFIIDDYLEVAESVHSLESKMDRLRATGFQEGKKTARTTPFATTTRVTRSRSS